MPSPLVEAAKKLRAERQKKVTAELKTEKKGAPKKTVPARNAVTADQALRSEHVGSEGERAFGTPIKDETSVSGKDTQTPTRPPRQK